MEPIIWTDDFSVGVAQLDEQHRRLIQIMNQLITKPQTTTRSETVSDLLSDMTKYAQAHFATEEGLMRQYNYPHLDEQVVQHRAFRKKTVDFCMATSLDIGTVPESMLLYLRDWWLDHILKSDMEYKPFFRKRGLR